jgi:hypothetical protein
MSCQGQVFCVESVVSGATLKINVQNRLASMYVLRRETSCGISYCNVIDCNVGKGKLCRIYQKSVSTARGRIFLEVDVVRKKQKAAVFEAKCLRLEQLWYHSQPQLNQPKSIQKRGSYINAI